MLLVQPQFGANNLVLIGESGLVQAGATKHQTVP
jgi:hypothetical protein